ncbi:hypothetical protein FRC06_003392 [Ceratobasidium sp. 370]|nr:hypothetical protein FRC06_003392 [Ceratobasidium sp. 370]
MSAGVNYVGGRGRIAPRQSKDIERVPKEHFAKQRFIDYTQTAQGVLNTQNAKPVFTMSFKHAPKNDLEHNRTFPRTTSTTGTQPGTSFGPHVASRPNKPTKQSKLLEMMDSEIRQGELGAFFPRYWLQGTPWADESFDASRSRISTMDTKRFAGLDVLPRKRKVGINRQGHPHKRPHTAFIQGSHITKDAANGARSLEIKRELTVTPKTRTFISPLVKASISVLPTQRGDYEEIVSSGIPGVNNGVKISQPPSQVVPMEEPNATEVSNRTDIAATRVDPQSQARPASPIIPPNLWDRAYLLAARTLGLPNPVIPLELSSASQGVPAGISVDHLVAVNGELPSNTAEHDATICAFNLVAPDLEVAFHGAPAEPVATSVTAVSPQTRLSDQPDSNEFECNSPVIIPAPGHGVPAIVDPQDGGGAAETAPHGESRVPRPVQLSDFDNRIRRGALASPLASHRPVGRLPIQQTPINSQHPRLRTSNGNIAGTAISPQIPPPWNTPNTKPQTKDQAGGTNYWLGLDQDFANSANCFSLFGDGLDGDSDG